MKVKELKDYLADVPDDYDIDFADGNFGGYGETLWVQDFTREDKNARILIRPPYWEALD